MKCVPRARIVGERESIDHAVTRQMLLFLDSHRSFKRWIRVFSNRDVDRYPSLGNISELLNAECADYDCYLRSFQREKN